MGLGFSGNVLFYFVSLPPKSFGYGKNKNHQTNTDIQIHTDVFQENSRVPRTHGTREKLLINVSNPSNPSILRQISGVLPRFVANSFA